MVEEAKDSSLPPALTMGTLVGCIDMEIAMLSHYGNCTAVAKIR